MMKTHIVLLLALCFISCSRQNSYNTVLTQADDMVEQNVVNYYKQCGNRPYLCRALYYQSMILYEQGHHDEALQRLKVGEELALTLSDVSLLFKYHESLCMVNYKAGGYALMLKYASLNKTNSLVTLKVKCEGEYSPSPINTF